MITEILLTSLVAKGVLERSVKRGITSQTRCGHNGVRANFTVSVLAAFINFAIEPVIEWPLQDERERLLIIAN